jgi:F-type H+-transporting ATPase subunit alpha
MLFAVTQGVFDYLSLDRISKAEKRIRKTVRENLPALCQRIEEGKKLSDEDRETLLNAIKGAVDSQVEKDRDANARIT